MWSFKRRMVTSLLDVVHGEPGRLESGHEHSENGTASSEVNHLGAHACIETAHHTLLGSDFTCLTEELEWEQVSERRDSDAIWLECLGNGLLLENGSGHIGPAVHGDTRSTGKET